MILFGVIFPILLVAFPFSPLANIDGGSGNNFSDVWIETTLKSVMENDGRIDPKQITISSTNQQVLLEGTVMTDFERSRAERLAAGTPGVKAVVNNLKVMPAFDRDAALSHEIRAAILQHPLIKVSNLTVKVENGVVALNGIVSNPSERSLINEMIRSFFSDVSAVKDGILILTG
jgi:osmotically-inducible protein OsmY